jgi:DNA-binding MarR family transcriptional regulator
MLRTRIIQTLAKRLAGPLDPGTLTCVTHYLDRHPRISFLFDLFALSHRVRALLGQAMADSGLRPDEYAMYSGVLVAGPLSISELAQLVGMPLTTVSDYVRTMTSRGHAYRSRNPADSRSYLVSLTEDGVAAHQEAMVSFAAAIDRVRQALPIPEQDLVHALHALDDAVRQVLEDLAAQSQNRRQQRAAGGREARGHSSSSSQRASQAMTAPSGALGQPAGPP